MASQATSVSHMPVSAVDDSAFWPQDLSDSSSLGLHFSPGGSTGQSESVHSNTSPAPTPKSDGAQSNGQNSQSAQQPARSSVAVACVPCRSRHLKCDGGVRCSRCRTDGVECTYIKSRRGWKGKRKNKPGENGVVASAGSVPGS
jgi:hypothetical protein